MNGMVWWRGDSVVKNACIIGWSSDGYGMVVWGMVINDVLC